MDNYKNKLGNLADKLRQEKPNIPIQEVKPLKVNVAEKVIEVQFNNWIPKALLKRLKAYGIEHDLSLKTINILALESYLNPKVKPEKAANRNE